jgi:hypothetical protein
MNHDDEKQLRILVWLHYLGAALAGVIPILGATYAGLGVAMVLGKLPGMSPAKGESFGWLPIAMGAFVVLIGVVSVSLNLLTARSLRGRKNHTFCLLTSALNCMHFPLGTLLGAFTIVVLCRPAVRAAFEPRGGRQAGPAPPPASGSPGLTSALGGR